MTEKSNEDIFNRMSFIIITLLEISNEYTTVNVTIYRFSEM